MSSPTIAIVGATGTVGRQLIGCLQLHDVEPDQVRFFSSDRTEAEELDYEEETLPTEQLGPDSFRGVQVAIIATPPEVAKTAALAAQQAGAWAIDLSGAFRVDQAVPLVSPGVNDGILDRPFTGRVVSVAHPATQAVLSVLQPLRTKFGLSFADATFLMGAASRGNAGQDLLTKQTAALLNGKDPSPEEEGPPDAVFPHRLAFNVLSAAGPFEGALCEAERHVLVEAARIWSGDALPALTATALVIPTFHGTTLVLSAHLQRPVDADGVRATLKEDSGLKIIDDPAQQLFPMPMLTTDDAAIHVGRIRAQGTRVQLVATLDNVFRLSDGAVELALKLAERT